MGSWGIFIHKNVIFNDNFFCFPFIFIFCTYMICFDFHRKHTVWMAVQTLRFFSFYKLLVHGDSPGPFDSYFVCMNADLILYGTYIFYLICKRNDFQISFSKIFPFLLYNRHLFIALVL